MSKKHKHQREAGATPLDAVVDGAVIPVGARMPRSFYLEELDRLQFELVRLQYWVKESGQRVVVLFEGRDAAGKGGTIKRIADPLNPWRHQCWIFPRDPHFLDLAGPSA